VVASAVRIGRPQFVQASECLHAQCWLAQDELRNGTLVMPFKTSIDLQYRYCAVHTRGNARNPSVRAFVEWLCVQGAQL